MTLKGPANVESIKYLDDGVLRISFDGTVKDIDISALDLVKRYPKLKDPKYVQKAYFEEGCIKWPDGGPWIDADELEFLPETHRFKKTNVASSFSKKIENAMKKLGN